MKMKAQETWKQFWNVQREPEELAKNYETMKQVLRVSETMKQVFKVLRMV
jgi:hypothetical protein